MALELRPTCEHCNKALPPAALDARIYPASTKVKHRPVDLAAHERFAAPIRAVAPEKR
jgi:hypothetical protein